ncbi:MAG: hypothetical protein DRP87_16460 [Spirochaetes bacterium]|nr:MAG: hypothetical protein DRP87_16460 [Spirochaetota bacterium]
MDRRMKGNKGCIGFGWRFIPIVVLLLAVLLFTGCPPMELRKFIEERVEEANKGHDTSPPEVISISPLDGAKDVERELNITATFSEEMDEATINTTTFLVEDGANAISGTVSYNSSSKKATFTPDNPLELLKTYFVTITTGVKDLAGNGLAQEKTWSFTTRYRRWTEPEKINSLGNIIEELQIGMAENGKAVVVWEDSNNIYSNIFSPNPGWSGESWVYGTADTLSNLNLSVSSTGYAFAIWEELSTNDEISAMRYNGSSWEEVTPPFGSDTNPTHPSIAVDDDGNAIAVWELNDGNEFGIACSEYYGGTWNEPYNLSFSSYDRQFSPKIASDGYNYIAVWEDWTIEGIKARRYDGESWYDEMSAYDMEAPGIAMSPEGRALAGFVDATTWTDIYIRIYDDGWQGSGAELLISKGQPNNGWIALNATPVYWGIVEVGDGDIYVNRRDSAGNLWRDPSDSEWIGYGWNPQIAVDDSDRVVAVWEGNDGITFSLYNPDEDFWSEPVVIGQWGSYPQLAMNRDGFAIVVWIDGSDIMASEFME